jgi:hypothetical protein
LEAKETVKTTNELCLIVCQEYRKLNGIGKPCDGLDCEVCQLTKQAEISFEAGKEEANKSWAKKTLLLMAWVNLRHRVNENDQEQICLTQTDEEYWEKLTLDLEKTAEIDTLGITQEFRKEGMREVVDFLGEEPFEHNYSGIISPYSHEHNDCFACKWQAFLKENGIQ